MPNLTPEKENTILEALRAKLALFCDKVITGEPLLDSKHDEIDLITVRNSDDETEIAYAKIDYSGWRDSLTDGCEDEPVVFLRYRIHLFQEYKERRSDASSSASDIKILDINLHNQFRQTANGARRLAPKSEHSPLQPIGDIVLDEDDLTGAFGHIRNYSIEVEIL